MRIIAGRWRGRTLRAPQGDATRPTADRARQALFDMLLHAPWAGREALTGAMVLDAFAGTGALGLEALSRGAGHAVFIDHAPAALAVIRANVRLLAAEAMCRVVQADLTQVLPRGRPAALVFLDPPYGQGLLPVALGRLRAAGWIAPGALVAAETGAAEEPAHPAPLAERRFGAARVTVWREGT